LTDDDLPTFFEMVRQNEVTQYLPWDTAQTPEDANVYLHQNISRFREQKGIVWGAVNREQDALMGSCTLFNLDTAHHRAELGYMLGSAWWRQGYMYEVCARVVAFGFAEM
ncbi:MAG: GNAT family N-acetyltransferase, partial [Chloroflexota bacterium]